MFKMKLQKRQVQMDKQNIRIKLRAYDNKVLDQSTEEIVNTVKRLSLIHI